MTLISNRTLGNSISSSEIHILCGPAWIQVEDIQSNQDLVSLEGLRLSSHSHGPGYHVQHSKSVPTRSFFYPPVISILHVEKTEAQRSLHLYKPLQGDRAFVKQAFVISSRARTDQP